MVRVMDITVIIPLADSWGMHDGDIGVGWLIVPIVLPPRRKDLKKRSRTLHVADS